jgi:serine/threonine protein kinase
VSDGGTPEWLSGLTDPVEIGRGGFGVVYKAVETDLNRSVAVKVLSGNLDDLALQRFDRERRAMGALSGHPNIVSIYRSGITPDNRPYLVMEYLPGGSMAERVAARGPLSWRDAADVGVRLCAALETAHRAGVLHRDVKPENVFVSGLGAPKLGDFGIARLEGAPQTQSAMITASLAHAAPELIDGKPPSVQSDVYGLASTIVTLMTGHPPFSRDTDESIVPLLARIATEPVPDLRHQGVPTAFCEAFERAMSKDPARRPESAAALGRALQDAQRTQAVDVTPLEVQGVDPTIAPGSGAPRVADPTVNVAAPTAAVTPPVPPAAASPRPTVVTPTPAAPVAPAPVVAPTPNPGVAPPAAGWASTPATTTPPGGYYPSTTGSTPSGGGPDRRLVYALAGLAAVVVVVLVVLVVLGGGGDGGDQAGPTTTHAPTTKVTETSATATSTGTDGPVTTLAPGSDGLNGLTVTSIPFGLGDSRVFDALAARCAAGGLESCDTLKNRSPRNSAYENFGATCGARASFDRDAACSDRDL